MGIFDNKPDSSQKKAADLSDTNRGPTGATGPSSSSSADYSDVTGGSSSGAPAASSAQSYTVKSGDSLSKIAKHFYGDGNKWHQIYEANRDKIKNPDLIHPGQELTIPAA
jgi:nucleoid-associated protein YgaU